MHLQRICSCARWSGGAPEDNVATCRQRGLASFQPSHADQISRNGRPSGCSSAGRPGPATGRRCPVRTKTSSGASTPGVIPTFRARRSPTCSSTATSRVCGSARARRWPPGAHGIREDGPSRPYQSRVPWGVLDPHVTDRRLPGVPAFRLRLSRELPDELICHPVQAAVSGISFLP